MEYAQQTIVDFLSGKLDIVEFRRLYDEKPEIDAFLQNIIDEMIKGNFSFAILIVGIAQLIAMLCKRK